jgi:hypothetical protein
MTLSTWFDVCSHAVALVALRQTQCIRTLHLLTQIELTLLRTRVYLGQREAECIRHGARYAMSYIRMMIRNRLASIMMDEPPPLRELGETLENVERAVRDATLDLERANRRREPLLMMSPPTPTSTVDDDEEPESEDGDRDSEDGDRDSDGDVA